nr:thiamine phosphate synthase [Motilibacter deserti]
MPRLLVLTDRRQCQRPLVDTVAAAVQGGARGVVLREKDLPLDERLRLAERLRAVLDPVEGLLVLAGAVPGAAAVHLAAADRLPDERPALVGRSCHDVAQVLAASEEGCDYVTVSPVFLTASKPGYGPALGLDGLAGLVRAAPGLPLVALGGIDPHTAAACRAAGAAAVAVMGAVMRAEHPDREVARLIAALDGDCGPVREGDCGPLPGGSRRPVARGDDGGRPGTTKAQVEDLGLAAGSLRSCSGGRI